MRPARHALLVALLLLPTTAAALPTLAPSAPQGVQAASEVGAVLLTWAAPADPGLGVTAYRVYRDGVLRATTPANVTSYRDAGLLPGETHAYAVAAVTFLVEGERSAPVDGSASATPPAPTGLTARGGHQSVTLSWRSRGGDAFRVYRDGAYLAETTSNASYVDTGLADGTTYSYAVSAVYLGNEGAASTPATATTLGAPGAPRNLTAEGVTGGIRLQWRAPAGAPGNWSNGTNGTPASYRVYADLGGWTLVGQTNGTNFTDAPLASGEARCYVVRAVNAVGEGPDSNQACATAKGTPGAPRNLTASVTSNGTGNASVTLHWLAPGSDGGYRILRYNVFMVLANGTRSTLGSTAGNVTTFRDATIAPGETRTYVVTAENAAGPGPESNAATATRP